MDSDEQYNMITNIRNQHPISTTNRDITLTVQPNGRPNIIIEHFAEITILSMFCNFGGLIGMYLGVSLQTITYDSWQIIRKNLMNYLSVRNNRINQILFIKRSNVIINNRIN